MLSAILLNAIMISFFKKSVEMNRVPMPNVTMLDAVLLNVICTSFTTQ